MKKTILFLLVIITLQCVKKTSKYADYPISVVSIKDVNIKDKFWLPRIKLIQDSTIQYALNKCGEEGRMDNFLVAGGKKMGAYQGKMPFDDTDLYKIIEGASYSLISQPNPDLEAYIDSIISIIKIGQEPDGYITTWFTIDRKNPPAWWVKPSVNRWDQVEASHELYNSGHLFEAAAAHFRATGNRDFLDIAIKNADLLVANFGPDKLSRVPGHQIVETGLIKLYQITKNEQYLELAKFFLDMRGDSTSHQLYGEYSQDHRPVIQQTEAVGHAVRALYMYAGMTDIAVMYRDTSYLKAVHKIWENIVNTKMYITGGLGSKREGEAFGENYELPNLTAYSETCAAIGSVYWNHRLFMLSGNSKYYDIIERTLYNGLISGISVDGINFFYPNPTESDGHNKFNMGSCTRQPWFDCSCCPTNLIRFIPSIPALIYATDKESMYINLFISSTAHVFVDGEKIEVTQKTDYPWDGKIKITIKPEKEKIFRLRLRLPGWTQNNPVPGDLYSYLDRDHGEVNLSINGKKEEVNQNMGYAEILRRWKKDDSVELIFPLTVHRIIADNKVKDDSNKVAFEFGPVVYCAEEVDNEQISDIVIPDDMDANSEERTVMSETVISINGKVDEEEIALIPYYLWSNRGVGKMKVWFPRNSN
jgi:DUF1680 family protein